MARISLEDYLAEIEDLIDDSRLTEAAAHCRHILNLHPRHIESYRLLGKVLLEQHDYSGAVDIFQRVLSAEPEDFIAHVGLSAAFKADDLLPEAIWHLERAYEKQPYNEALQVELRELYAARDGFVADRIMLTRGALANLYYSSELYQRAIVELRSLLSEQRERIDLQVLLAETLWRDDQRVDAVEVCLSLLDTLPYCLKANAILAEIWLLTDRAEEAQQFLKKLRVMTLPDVTVKRQDSPLGRAFAVNGDASLPNQMVIERLDPSTQPMETTEESVWGGSLSAGEEPFGEAVNVATFDTGFGDDNASEWLQAISALPDDGVPDAAATDDPFAQATEPISDPSSEESDDVLDWLREVAVSDETAEESSLSEDLEEPDWLEEQVWEANSESDVSATADAIEPDGDLPDWLDGAAKDEATSSSATPDVELNDDWLSSLSEDEPADAFSLDDEEADLPDWLVESEELATDSASDHWLSDVPDDAEEATNDPLAGFVDADSSSLDLDEPETEGAGFTDWLAESASTSDPDSALPDWLSDEEYSAEDPWGEVDVDQPNVGAMGGSGLTNWLTDQAADDADDMPDWMTTNEAAASTPEDAPARSDVSSEPSFTDWLDARQEGESSEDSLADWLTDEDDETDAFVDASLPTNEGAMDGSGLTAWLSEAASEDKPGASSSVSSDDDLPDWLDAEKDESKADESVSLAAAAATLPPDDLPDWLNEDDKETNLSEGATDGSGMTDWLTELQSVSDPTTNLQALSGENDDALPDWLTEPTEAPVPDDQLDEPEPDVAIESMLDLAEDEPANDEVIFDGDEPTPDSDSFLDMLADNEGLSETHFTETEDSSPTESEPLWNLDDVPDDEEEYGSTGFTGYLEDSVDWLSELDDRGNTSTLDENDLPDWLRDMQDNDE